MSDCAWHEGLEGRKVDYDDPADSPYEGCSHCGRLLETKDCKGCGLTFLDWSAKGYDDVLSAPCATPAGDLCCIPCARRAEREEEEACEEEYDDYDPYDAIGESRFGLPGGGTVE